MKQLRSMVMASSLFAMAGCMSLAPDYVRPKAPIPEKLYAQTLEVEGANLLLWNDIVESEALRRLITLGLQENKDLQVTAANIRVANAQIVASRAGLFPYISGSAAVQEGDVFDSTATSQVFADSALAQLGVTAWELDFFGRTQSGNQAAMQAYLATVEGNRAARISLIASICEAWLQLSADRELLSLAEDTVSSQSESFGLTKELFNAGAANELDVRRASASVQTALAQAATFKAAVRQDLNLLRRLVGTELPEDTLQEAVLAPMPLVAELPVSRSSSVLLLRPDVMAAEHSLRAANANIGVARAAYFPSISLTGSVGYQSQDLSDLVGGNGVGGWSFGPSINLPVFDGGARRGNLEASKAVAESALASYQISIQSAFRETADALAVAETIDARLTALEQLTEDTGITLYLSGERFRAGLVDYLAVLDAQRENYSGRQQLIAARLDRGRNTVALFRALGGWADDAASQE